MSERMTTVRPRKASEASGIGLMLYGRWSREEAIAELRKHAQSQMDKAYAVLICTDEELIVETHTGQHVRRGIKEVT